MSVRLPAAARFLVLTGIVLTATILVSPARAAAPTIHCPADLDFTPIMCELVPIGGQGAAARSPSD